MRILNSAIIIEVMAISSLSIPKQDEYIRLYAIQGGATRREIRRIFRSLFIKRARVERSVPRIAKSVAILPLSQVRMPTATIIAK